MMQKRKIKYDLKDKEKFVKNVFSTVSSNYDLMNDLMSLGIHRLWKDNFIKNIPEYSAKLIDVAGGTGDIALKYYKRAISKGGKPDITIVDINYDMLKSGYDNAINNNLIDKFKYVCSDATNLPFSDNSFDYYTIAYGIRNVVDIDKAIKEAYRVLKERGKFLCLEFSHVRSPNLSKLYDFYSYNFIPYLGDVITGSKESYEYLVDSIRAFPSQEDFAKIISKNGFKMVNYENLSFGVSAIHWGYKL